MLFNNKVIINNNSGIGPSDTIVYFQVYIYILRKNIGPPSTTLSFASSYRPYAWWNFSYDIYEERRSTSPLQGRNFFFFFVSFFDVKIPRKCVLTMISTIAQKIRTKRKLKPRLLGQHFDDILIT